MGEDVPCLTYGLRGVIHASIEVSNKLADLHSGVEGGAVSEPLIDLIHVTSKLVDSEKNVLIPGKVIYSVILGMSLYSTTIPIGFYENVSTVTEAEEKLYDPIVEWLQT